MITTRFRLFFERVLRKTLFWKWFLKQPITFESFRYSIQKLRLVSNWFFSCLSSLNSSQLLQLGILMVSTTPDFAKNLFAEKHVNTESLFLEFETRTRELFLLMRKNGGHQMINFRCQQHNCSLFYKSSSLRNVLCCVM